MISLGNKNLWSCGQICGLLLIKCYHVAHKRIQKHILNMQEPATSSHLRSDSEARQKWRIEKEDGIQFPQEFLGAKNVSVTGLTPPQALQVSARAPLLFSFPVGKWRREFHRRLPSGSSKHHCVSCSEAVGQLGLKPSCSRSQVWCCGCTLLALWSWGRKITWTA